MKAYKIEPDQLSKFMFKKALTDVLILVGSIIVLALIIGFATEMKVAFLLLKGMWVGIFIFLLVMFLFSFLSSNISGSTMYVVGDNFFARGIDAEGVNALDRMALNRLERKTGQKKFDKIYFNETKSIKMTDNKIIIKGEGYNFFNGNGRIAIPCEVGEYDDLKEKVKNICRSNRNIDRQFDY